MLRKMGGSDWREILLNDGADFGVAPGRQTFALRRRADVKPLLIMLKGNQKIQNRISRVLELHHF